MHPFRLFLLQAHFKSNPSEVSNSLASKVVVNSPAVNALGSLGMDVIGWLLLKLGRLEILRTLGDTPSCKFIKNNEMLMIEHSFI